MLRTTVGFVQVVGLNRSQSCDEEVPRSAARRSRLLHFCVERMMRFTNETDMPNVRAIVAGFSPALNDARMRFAFPSGISTTCLVSTGGDIGRDALGADASLVLPVEVLCLRLTISASTAACSR